VLHRTTAAPPADEFRQEPGALAVREVDDDRDDVRPGGKRRGQVMLVVVADVRRRRRRPLAHERPVHPHPVPALGRDEEAMAPVGGVEGELAAETGPRVRPGLGVVDPDPPRVPGARRGEVGGGVANGHGSPLRLMSPHATTPTCAAGLRTRRAKGFLTCRNAVFCAVDTPDPPRKRATWRCSISVSAVAVILSEAKGSRRGNDETAKTTARFFGPQAGLRMTTLNTYGLPTRRAT